jgi:hypothetical protein
MLLFILTADFVVYVGSNVTNGGRTSELMQWLLTSFYYTYLGQFNVAQFEGDVS